MRKAERRAVRRRSTQLPPKTAALARFKEPRGRAANRGRKGILVAAAQSRTPCLRGFTAL